MSDVKISELSAATAVTPDDLLVMVDDPSGAPVTKKVSALILRRPTVVSLSYAATVGTDASTGDIFDLTLTGNVTLSAPINGVNGQTVRWRITQDATGGRTVTLGEGFAIPSSATSPLPFSTAANKTDLLAATYHAGLEQWQVVACVPGY